MIDEKWKWNSCRDSEVEFIKHCDTSLYNESEVGLTLMNADSIYEFEQELVSLGNEIANWREDKESRKLNDPIAFKTQADLRAHEHLSKLIDIYYPDAPVISEEDEVFGNKRPARYWLIDPIDGTASWYNGFDGFVTQVAFIESDIPVYGAVYAPVLDKLWSAVKGRGARLNNVLMPRLVPHSRLNLVDNYPQPSRIADTVNKNMKVTKYIESGSLGLKSCLVADGTADLFVKDVLIRDWDIAPAMVIINEVGGVMADLNGNSIRLEGSFEKEDGLIVARDQKLVEQVLKIAHQRA